MGRTSPAHYRKTPVGPARRGTPQWLSVQPSDSHKKILNPEQAEGLGWLCTPQSRKGAGALLTLTPCWMIPGFRALYPGRDLSSKQVLVGV